MFLHHPNPPFADFSIFQWSTCGLVGTGSRFIVQGMSKHTNPINRRSFLRRTGVAASAGALAARSYAQVKGANQRVNVGLIGCGTIANLHLKSLLRIQDSDNLRIVGLSDVYETRARSLQDRISRIGGNAQVETDYRRLLEIKELDYVLIATPEHWHAQQVLDALDVQLHVYCEKPLTHSLEEAFQVRDRVRETGLKLQVGVQGMSDDSYASAYRAIRQGALGPVVEAQIDYVRNHPANRGPWRTGVDPDLPKPEDLNWKAWLGPAPQRPWSPSRYFEWRNYRDYSGGVATDLFVHRLTRILKACGLGFPQRVVGMGGIYLWDDGRELPDNFEMLLEYPSVANITKGMTVHVLGTMANNRGNDHLIRGKDATLVFNSGGWEIVQQGTGEVVQKHQRTGAEDITLHHRNLLAAIRDDAPLHCPVDLGLYGVAAVIGANQSWFERRMLAWDDANQRWS